MITTTVTTRNAEELAALINRGFEVGEITVVNGEKLKRRFSAPVARAWLNGTVSVTVEGRERGKVREVYVKVGGTLSAN